MAQAILGPGMTGESITSLHRRLVLRGVAVPADELQEDRFGPGTEAAIRTFQIDAGLPMTGVVDEATALGLGLGPAPTSITGVVCRPDGTPLEDVAVRLYRQTLDGDAVVAETRSGPEGRYSLAWPDGDTRGLTVRADGSAGVQPPAKTQLSSGATWVRLSVGGEYRGATRFGMLTAELTPAVGARGWHTIRGAATPSDLINLSRATAVPDDEVARVVLAHQLSRVTSLDASVFYALLLQLGPAAAAEGDDDAVDRVLDRVLAQKPDDVRSTLKAAAAANVIADLDVDAVAARMHALRIDSIAEQPLRWGAPLPSTGEHECCAPSPGSRPIAEDGQAAADASTATARSVPGDSTPLRQVLTTATSDARVQREVLEVLAAHDGTRALETELDGVAGLSSAQKDALRFTLEATAALANHVPLVQSVLELRTAGRVATIGDLARLDQADWARLLRQADPKAERIAPGANARIEDPARRIDRFASTLAARFESRYPTRALTGRLEKDPAELPLAQTRRVQQFLEGAPSFCVRHTHVDRFVSDLRSSGTAAGDDRSEVVSDLKTLQRAYRLTPRFAHVKALLESGHASAYSVYATGREPFVAALTARGVAPGEAGTIFDQAEQVHATTLTLLGNFNSAFTSATPSAVGEPVGAAAARSGALAAFPTLQSLFGSNDYCACENCRAIHGPAAYLVDILQFLKSRPATTGFAREVLLGRRPDLGAIELSCPNTNGVVPYIDLACEVLEDAVAAPTPAAVRARQTSGTAGERRANPAFVNEAAYNTLRGAVFPHVAPFDLWTAETRAFLRQLGVPRHDLMAAFQVPGQAGTDVPIAGERFGFSAPALAIVTTPAPALPWTHWGLQETGNSVPDPRKPDDATAVRTGTWLQILGFVPILLDRAKVQHRELVQLLATRFVNPDGTITIVEAGTAQGFASCDTGKQTITTWTAEALSRFGRFLRLWRQLGCTIWDLDKALCTPGVGNTLIDGAAIAQLGRLDALAMRLGRPWDELLALWTDMDRFNYVNVLVDPERIVPSVYARRFRDATVTQSSVFVEDPMALTGQLGAPEAIAGMSAALDLSADDIQRIRRAGGLTGTIPLNLTNLSVIFRYAVLASALRLPVPDLLTAIAVAGVNPFLNPTTTLQFVTALDQVRDSGFTLPELDYLLRHGSVRECGIGLGDATVTGWLDDLRKGLSRLGTAPAAAAADQVVQQVSAALSFEPSLTRGVLQATLPGGTSTMAALFVDPRLTQRAADGSFSFPATRASFPAIFDAFTALDKMRLLLARWRVGNADAAWLVQNAAAAGWMGPHTLPSGAAAPKVLLATLDILRSNVVFQQTLVSPAGSRLFDIVLQGGTRDAMAGRLAQVGGWSDAEGVVLAARFGWTTAAAVVARDRAAQTRDLLAWPRKLGTDLATTLTLVAPAIGAPEARKVRQLTKARFTAGQWNEVAGSIQDRLREQKRAALVAWLLANPNAARGQKWVTVEDLYGFYLIDPEMAPTSVTTRIKQAAASVQLFVQRCILQLEPSVSVDAGVDSAWSQWDWLKRFRLWEANRKVFLYPENWLDPGQRRDKSAFFRDLEDELRQGDLTFEDAEDALLKYVHKLAEVSHLEVSGMWEEWAGTGSRLDVVARTRKAPYVYYHRRRQPTGAWGAWEPLDVGIEADHIMPAIWNKRMYLLWPEFTRKSLPSTAAHRTIPSSTPGTVVADSVQYWEIALAWTEKRGELWMPKRLSQRKQLVADGGMLAKRLFLFRVATQARSLAVELYAPSLSIVTPSPLKARWLLTSAQDEPSLSSDNLTALAALDEIRYLVAVTPGNPKIGARIRFETRATPPVITDVSFHFNAYGGDPGPDGIVSLQKLAPDMTLQLRPMLRRVRQPRVISARHGDLDQFQSSFVISDQQRTFFVPDGSWRLSPHYHPFVETFVQTLNIGGADALYDRLLQTDPDQVRGTGVFDFAATYEPTTFVTQPYPTEQIDYSPSGAYSAYNWELFVHVPLLVARRLADNQRFAEAMRWLHYVFNPTTVAGGTVPQRYWNPRVFRDLTAPDYARQQIEQLLQLVNQGDPELAQRVAEWRAHPFDPHLVAASRPVAYQKAAVMQYISTLIAWGDQLFRGDTIESINEATQLYLIASQLLGPRPQNVRGLQPRQSKTYAELAPALDTFANAVVDIENVVSIPPPNVTPGGPPLPQLHTFYFCIPPNDQMLSYWDTVSDRLFKIRNGLNLEGVARPLALYEPPIDPGLLVRAAAAGIELSAAIADIDAAMPCYRFTTVWQVAHDLCQDVRSLGAAILAALERRDAEEISRVRATQEVAVLDATRAVKANQLAEAGAQLEGLRASQDMAVIRRDYYASREFLNAPEALGLTLVGQALTKEESAVTADVLAATLFALPNAQFGGSGFGGSPVVTTTVGGELLGRATSARAGVLRAKAGILSQRAGMSGTLASYMRRAEDWDLQRRLAVKEISQLGRQILAAELRVAIGQQELDVHRRQLEHARTNAELLESKFTRQELFDWSVSQLATTYFQSYQLAYDLAKRASRSYAFELGTADPGYIQFGYWDSLAKGLHAGDKLLLDLRRLQTERLDRNRRDLELTRHVSLMQLDPAALVKLRQTGDCFIDVPESLFDHDQPGHYLRRIKSVSVTLPCVTGPYTGVNATLTLVGHSTRISSVPGTPYLPALDPADGLPSASDPRFSRGTGAVQSVALSTGREDAGMFEVNFHDERYLPFEGLGAISHWRLELPKDCNHFDVSTLSDVVMHLRYTARDGGPALRAAARQAVTAALPRAGAQLLSARSDFPDAWARLLAPVGAGQSLELALGEQHFPYIASGQQIAITALSALLLFTADRTYVDYEQVPATARLKCRLGFAPAGGGPPATSVTFAASPALGQIPAAPLTLAGPVRPLAVAFREPDLAAAPLLDQVQTAPDGTTHHRLDRNKIDDILILVSYRVEAQP